MKKQIKLHWIEQRKKKPKTKLKYIKCVITNSKCTNEPIRIRIALSLNDENENDMRQEHLLSFRMN